MGVLHFALVRKPFALTDPVAVYILSFGVLGIVCWLYTLLPFGRNLARHRYRVRAVDRAGDTVAVTLEPLRRGLSHRPGQFAFLSFDVAGMRETHPFTISSAPAQDRSLRFSIKPLGDFTQRLERNVAVGQLVRVSGPHGRFLRTASKGPEVWIAGGIGVAPFVAWAGALPADAGPVHMFYCVRGMASAAHLDELRATAARVPGFVLHVVDSTTERRFAARRVAEEVAMDLAAATVAFCGPKSMREELRRDLAALGLKRGRFRYEEFEIRTSIWPMDLLFDRVRTALGDLGAGLSPKSRGAS